LRDDSREDRNDDSDLRTAEHQAASSFPNGPSRDIAPRDLAHCFQRGLDDMKPPCGARWCRPSSCSNQSDGDKPSAI
jgi:hypothetical protein